jgi:ABC-type transport system involved in multi-copper enzyme maturation permease subunit
MAPERPSQVRAWFYLIGLSLRRQARARQMVLIALALLAFAAAFVAIATPLRIWDLHSRAQRLVPGGPRLTCGQVAEFTQVLLLGRPGPTEGGVELGILASIQAAMNASAFHGFTDLFVMVLFLGFLVPIWALSFASEALGGEREGGSLIWLLSRSLPRWAVYLAKFLALLPWSLGLCLGGFALLCLLAGEPGGRAFLVFWPAVLWSALAFSALFYLVGALFHRPAVIAIVYVFFVEPVLNLLPGYPKRFSINFYARCMMYEAAQPYWLDPKEPMLMLASDLPVDATTAWVVLAALTVALVGLGMLLFSRAEFHDGV